MTNKKILIDVKLLIDIYKAITASNKIDCEDEYTSRLYKVIKDELKNENLRYTNRNTYM